MTSSAQASESGNAIVRDTASSWGRQVAIAPGRSSMRHLQYARIRLNAARSEVSWVTGPRETGFICLSGAGEIAVAGQGQPSQRYRLERFDSLYVPRNASVKIESTAIDLAECAADVEGEYPVQFVPYAQVAADSGLCFVSGKPPAQRKVAITLGQNIQAGRIVAGFTCSDPGNWTSWPPHEHERMLEEIYLYFDMPAPAYAVQLVYTDERQPDFAGIVRDGDAVLMPRGYHPNVAIPGHPVNFVWMMAAHREVEDRHWGVVNVQPGFEAK